MKKDQGKLILFGTVTMLGAVGLVATLIQQKKNKKEGDNDCNVNDESDHVDNLQADTNNEEESVTYTYNPNAEMKDIKID